MARINSTKCVVIERHTNSASKPNVTAGTEQPAAHTFGAHRHFAVSDVPMLVQSFRNADHEWAIDESLFAACTLCSNMAGRTALIQHGMLKAVQSAMLRALVNDPNESEMKDGPYVLNKEAKRSCAELLAAFAKCKICRSSLSAKPETATVIIGALRSFLPVVQSERGSQNGVHTSARSTPEVQDNLLMALSAATDSSSSQHAVLTWCTNAKFEEKDSFHDERDSMISSAEYGAVPASSPAYLVISECIRVATSLLATLATMEANGDLRGKNALHGNEKHKNYPPGAQVQRTFDLLQAACEVLEHLGSHGSAARTMLRSAGVVETCFYVIAAIRDYAARHDNEKLGTNALAAAVATLRRVSIVAGHAYPNSLHGVPIVYDVLRSQLSRPSIQQQGLQLMHVLGRTGDGARKLDSMPGSWQWLGRAQFPMPKRGEPYPWVAAKDPAEVSGQSPKTHEAWSATRLANFLNLRGLKQDSCEDLQQNVEELRILSLLPFEGEFPNAWEIRMAAFESRNDVSFIGGIRSRKATEAAHA